MKISGQKEMPIQSEIFFLKPCIVLFIGNPVSEALNKQKARKRGTVCLFSELNL